MNISDHVHPRLIDAVLKQAGIEADEKPPGLLAARPAVDLIRLLAETEQWEPFYERLKEQAKIASAIGLNQENVRDSQAYLVLRLGIMIGLRAADTAPPRPYPLDQLRLHSTC